MLHRHLSITIIQCKLRICDSKVFVLSFRKINIFVLKWSKKKKDVRRLQTESWSVFSYSSVKQSFTSGDDLLL